MASFKIEFLEDYGCSSGDLSVILAEVFFLFIPQEAQHSAWRASCLSLRDGNGCLKGWSTPFPCFLCIGVLSLATTDATGVAQ